MAAPPKVPKKIIPYELVDAKARVLAKMPYIYAHVASMVPVARPGLGTFGVDEWLRMYYDPALLEVWDINECMGVIVHESLHLILHTAERCKALLGENPTMAERAIFNVASDLVINEMLTEARIPLPAGGVSLASVEKGEPMATPYGVMTFKKKIKLPANESHEYYFEKLYDALDFQSSQPGQGQGQGQGEPGQGGGDGDPWQGPPQPLYGGSGADGNLRPWECPPPGVKETANGKENPAGMDKLNQDMLERHVAGEIESHQKNKGNVPGGLKRFAKDKLHPTVDPLENLRAACRYHTMSVRGYGDYTYSRLPRRAPPGSLRMPAHVKPMPKVFFIVDTSGSMDQRDLAKALGTIENALRDLPPGAVTVMVGDYDAHHVGKVFNADQIELLGGGGTSMTRLLMQAMEQKEKPTAIVVLTDGETDWPAQELPVPVVAAITRPNHGYPCPAWLNPIYLKDEECT